MIEPRRLMAATGLDSAFADNGTLTLGEGVKRAGTALATANALYVGAYDDSRAYVYKFSADGEADAGFGNNGRAAIGVMPQKLAVDRKSGTVFAAGKTFGEATGPVEGLYVARIEADGTTDKNYGSASGAYVPQLGHYYYIVAQVESLTALSNGKLLMAASVNTLVNDPTPKDQVDLGMRDLTLVCFNAAGKRDGDFGRRGMRTLYSAATRNDERARNQSISTSDGPGFADAQLATDGSGRIVFIHERQKTVTDYGQDKNIVKITGESFVESIKINTDGDLSAARIWSLGKTKPSDARDTNPRDLRVITAQAGGDTNVRAFAIRDSLRPLVYTLTKDNSAGGGKTPTPLTLTLPSTNAVDELAGRIGVVPLMGGYYVTNGSGGAAKYTVKNVIDATFGDDGVARFNGTGIIDYRSYAADSQGRLLVLNEATIRRLNV